MYPAFLQVTDIAGLIRGASQGEGLGNAFLSHIQAVDGMFHIVRYELYSSARRCLSHSDLAIEHSTMTRCCTSTTRSILFAT